VERDSLSMEMAAGACLFLGVVRCGEIDVHFSMTMVGTIFLDLACVLQK
jgi:hypothetical protein